MVNEFLSPTRGTLKNSTTVSPFTESQSADFTLGTLYIVCLLFGVPANVAAFSYFMPQNKDLSTCLYLVITVVDILICGTSSIIGFNMFRGRKPLLFAHSWFCVGWRMIFKSLQRLSVFLVLILSISRATVLVIPLHLVRKRTVLCSIVCYTIYLVVENVFLERHENMIYDRVDVYCYEQDNKRLLSVLNDSLHVATLAVPLIPIVISCIVSVHHVRNSLHLSSHHDLAGAGMKRRATVTVIIFTVTYLCFNIPLIANLVLWIVTVNHYGGWPGPVYFTNTFMYMYCWNLTDVLFVGLNATANPIIYFLRFPNCQRWTKTKLRRLYLKMSGRAGEAPTEDSKMLTTLNCSILVNRRNHRQNSFRSTIKSDIEMSVGLSSVRSKACEKLPPIGSSEFNTRNKSVYVKKL